MGVLSPASQREATLRACGDYDKGSHEPLASLESPEDASQSPEEVIARLEQVAMRINPPLLGELYLSFLSSAVGCGIGLAVAHLVGWSQGASLGKLYVPVWAPLVSSLLVCLRAARADAAFVRVAALHAGDASITMQNLVQQDFVNFGFAKKPFLMSKTVAADT